MFTNTPTYGPHAGAQGTSLKRPGDRYINPFCLPTHCGVLPCRGPSITTNRSTLHRARKNSCAPYRPHRSKNDRLVFDPPDARPTVESWYSYLFTRNYLHSTWVRLVFFEGARFQYIPTVTTTSVHDHAVGALRLCCQRPRFSERT